jgi:hypothetical protein
MLQSAGMVHAVVNGPSKVPVHDLFYDMGKDLLHRTAARRRCMKAGNAAVPLGEAEQFQFSRGVVGDYNGEST